ncbi:MAG: Txe/YoeB family addiction module toxin [Chlorobiaceae bacterium]|nr:Txe/YoeB family addiction module toxin [Chlorobiaceae bacterium]
MDLKHLWKNARWSFLGEIELLKVLENNPYQIQPPYEKLVGDLTGAYSRRFNIKHRLVYQVIENEHIVKVIRMWTHYE